MNMMVYNRTICGLSNKILGASPWQLVLMLVKQILIVVLVAGLVALPVVVLLFLNAQYPLFSESTEYSCVYSRKNIQ
ncbi:MAG: FtsX-like permease family protein [Pseudohongiellaceae bacterium]